MGDVYQNILQLLQEWGVEHRIIQHADVWTCDKMAEFCGCSEAEILKSAVMEDSQGRFWIYVLPGDKKIRSNALRRWLEVKSISFAKKERAEKVCGCDIGCIPPFGHSTPIPVIVDHDTFGHEFGYLSPGRHDCSIRIPTAALRRVENMRIYREEQHTGQ